MLWWKMIFNRLRAALGIVQYDTTNGLNVAGTALDGAPPSFTWASKPALGAPGYVNTVVLITNLHSRGTTGGSLWMNTSGGYILISQPVNVTWAQVSSASYFGTAGGELDAATWSGLRLHVTDYFVGGADIYSNGTRWRLASERATLRNYTEAEFGTVAINQTNTIISYATWPVGLYANGDILRVQLKGQKSGATDTQSFKLDYSTTSNTYAAGTVLTTTSAITLTTDSLSSAIPIIRKSSTVLKVFGSIAWGPQPGPSAADIAADVTVTNLDTTQGYILWAATTAANETFLPTGFIVQLETCGT